jgi:small subunit ribosomal protein S16
MPVKMRLQRYGKKRSPYFHIVIADGRAPRDGKYIEKIGMYNPTKNPAEINIDFEAAMNWLKKGAQPTDTVRAILSYKGVLYKYHLMKGVQKGAFDEAQAEVKFQAWLKEKEAKIAAKVSSLEEKTRAEKKAGLEAETKIREAREAVLAKRKAVELEAEAAAAKAIAAEKAAKEAEKAKVETAEKVNVEAPAEEKAEVKEEAPVVEEKAKEVKAEEKEEAPAAEKKTEETKTEDKA